MGSEDEIQTIRRTGRGRGRGRGRPPGRPAKKTKSPKKGSKSEKSVKKEKDIAIEDKDIENSLDIHNKKKDSLSDLKSPIDFEDSIESDLTSGLSFVTPASKALHGNEPLNWKYKVNLIGEKVVNPRIHCCEKCLLPILVYGRMIACKHVFCLSCSQQNDKQCPRCGDKVLRVEKSPLGTVFMCQTESCKRTYLSQRDLQAHIEHRHLRRQMSNNALSGSNSANLISTTNSSSKEITSHSGVGSRSSQYNNPSFQSPIPVVSSRSNLITVPIQDEVSTGHNSMTSNVNSQSSMLVSPPQTVPNYGVPQQNPYGHPNPHMQWPSIPTTNAYGYRPPHSWPPINPYNNPFNRPYGYPQ